MASHSPTGHRTRIFQWITDRYPTERINGSLWVRLVYRLLLETVRPDDPIVVRTPHYRLRFKRRPKRQIARFIAIKHGYEPMTTELFKRHAPPGGVVVDVGANIGHFTLVAAKAVGSEGHVYAFEPVPALFAELAENVHINGLDNTTLVQAALGETEAVANLYTHRRNPGGHSLSESNVSDGIGEILSVETRTLDQFARERLDGRPVRLIKIDVEGSEGAVIKGAQEVLREHRPVLVFEFWPYGLTNCGHDPKAMLEGLAAIGYRFRHIDETAGRVADTTVDELVSALSPDSRDDVAYVLALGDSGWHS